MSNKPPIPAVVLTTKRLVATSALSQLPCKASLTIVKGNDKLRTKLNTIFLAGPGTISRYAIAIGRSNTVSIILLTANMTRLAGSKGSFTVRVSARSAWSSDSEAHPAIMKIVKAAKQALPTLPAALKFINPGYLTSDQYLFNECYPKRK